jgi:hypothetical protein
LTPELHIIGIDPGATTGWCRLTVPTKAFFGKADSRILEWDYGEFTGPEPQQALDIARLARETQGLAYKTGPALLVERWDQDPRFKSTDNSALSPVRIGAMLTFLEFMTRNSLNQAGLLGDSTLTFQGRTQVNSNRRTPEAMGPVYARLRPHQGCYPPCHNGPAPCRREPDIPLQTMA